jgi:hypothetical protein
VKIPESESPARDLVVLDPSRVAAQIVSGIAFMGGLIFTEGERVESSDNRGDRLAFDRCWDGVRAVTAALAIAFTDRVFYRGVPLSLCRLSTSWSTGSGRAGKRT